MFNTTRLFLRKTTDFLLEEIEDRITDIISRERLIRDGESRANSLEDDLPLVHID